jgi:hypothetical protein
MHKLYIISDGQSERFTERFDVDYSFVLARRNVCESHAQSDRNTLVLPVPQHSLRLLYPVNQ